MVRGCRGAASYMMLNVVSGATALAMAAAGVIMQADRVVDISIAWGTIFQLLALGGVALIWWGVRNAFTNLQKRVAELERSNTGIRERVAEIAGACSVCTGGNTRRITPVTWEEDDDGGA